MKIRAADGYYLPSCFFMHISSKDDISKAIGKNEQTFVHEYLHFLQDLIFPYNIRYTLTENRKFKYLNVTALDLGEIQRPFDKWDSDTELTDEQFSYTWGGADVVHPAKDIESINSEYFTTYTGANVYKYLIRFKDGTNYQIGARDFLEYIAHKIESSQWQTYHPDYPYKSVDFVFDYFGLNHLSDEIRVCIIEYCMFNDNPMHRLYTLLNEELKQSPDQFLDYDTCKAFLLNLHWVAVGTGLDTIFTKSSRRLIQLRDSLKEKYENEFYSISEWIDCVVDYSKSNFSDKFIFSELLIMTKTDFFTFINGCVRDIGIPLVFNDNNESISLLPQKFNQNDFLQLYVAYNFMNYSVSNQPHCNLHNYCLKNDPAIMDHNCRQDPIARAQDAKLCPMGQFVKTYGFDQVTWINT